MTADPMLASAAANKHILSSSEPTSCPETPCTDPATRARNSSKASLYQAWLAHASQTSSPETRDHVHECFTTSPDSNHMPRMLAYRRRASNPRLLGTLVIALCFMIWRFLGDAREFSTFKHNAARVREAFLTHQQIRGFKFFPVTNQFYFVGRWPTTSNRLRRDATFSGSYVDISVRNTTKVILALGNRPEDSTIVSSISNPVEQPRDRRSPMTSIAHLSFRPHVVDSPPSAPVSLITRIDDGEYMLLLNCSGLVHITEYSLDPGRDHHIRIVAPSVENGGRDNVELEGLWLNTGGILLTAHPLGSVVEEDIHAEDALADIASNPMAPRIDMSRATQTNVHADDFITQIHNRHKMLEIVTDVPGYVAKDFQISHMNRMGADGTLKMLMGWEFIVGEMFGVDHSSISVGGMCLMQECFGGVGSPAGLGDTFFRSGQPGAQHFERSWTFSDVPDVLVLNIGTSDAASIITNEANYNQTVDELTERFEKAYLSLIRGIRRLGYPKHPAILQSERLGRPGYVPPGSPAIIPIFVMRPFQGQLEHSIQRVVSRLRAEGDKSIFWLDTSGWLEHGADDLQSKDHFLDDSASSPRWELTDQGNQKVALYLHAHICRYLASDPSVCPFLPQEAYTGSVYDAADAALEHYVEEEKIRRFRAIFMADDDMSTSP